MGRGLLNAQEIDAVFRIFRDRNPAPQTELMYVNTYTLVVAVVLSAQSTDQGVNRATQKLFERVTTPEQMVELGEATLREMIATIGLYRTKAKHVIQLSQRLIQTFGGQVPAQRTDLESLPGVGRKTANVVLNVAFHQPVMPVDTHIFRVANRLGLASGKTPLQVEEQLNKRIPQEFMGNAHHWLILHGRYVCKALKPLCATCPVWEICGGPRDPEPSLPKAPKKQRASRVGMFLL